GDYGCVTCKAKSGSNNTVTCDVGKYLDANNKCQDCPDGYTSNKGAKNEKECYAVVPAGSEIAKAGAKPSLCAAGSFAGKERKVNYGSKSICQECAVGTYQDNIGAITCKTCSTAEKTGQSSCHRSGCASGEYRVTEGGPLVGTCQKCPTYFNQSDVNATSAIGCYYELKGGKYNNSSNIATLCQAGTYREPHKAYYNQADSCKVCDVGYYAEGEQNAECTKCPDGTTTVGKGSKSKSDCKAYKCYSCQGNNYSWALNEPSSSCGVVSQVMSSSTGTYVTATQSNCKGTYKDNLNRYCRDNQKYYICPSGYVEVPNSKDSKGCRKCVQIPACEIGKYAASDGNGGYYCESCEKGTYQDVPGARVTSCKTCPAGQWQDHIGMSYCNKCRAGTYSTTVGATFGNVCQACKAGTYSSEGATSCQECGKGQYQDKTGKSSCKDCPKGSYQDKKGQTSCIKCSIGTYTNTEGAVSCQTCEAGYGSAGFTNYNEGSTRCYTTCGQGGYFDVKSGTCKKCPVGYTDNWDTGATDITHCYKLLEQGASINYPTQASSTACQVGYYQGSRVKVYYGSTYSCQKCGKGTYTNVIGQSSCIQCPKNTYQDKEGATSCKACPKGTTSPKGSTSYLNCQRTS
ncbi:MAG: hypothetical protein II119_00500, partial [Bacilli bacterium]|nr:hypothetical protein [Bacilli bacterium]